MQMFFFHEHRSIGWQLQLMRLDSPEVFEASGLAEFSVVVWSERTPRSIVPLTMMVVCPEFCILFTWTDASVRFVIFYWNGNQATGPGPPSVIGTPVTTTRIVATVNRSTRLSMRW
jgi:hypothetical protein